jgi:hypothetical protein
VKNCLFQAIVVLVCVAFSFISSAQINPDSTLSKKMFSTIGVGYMVGGQVYNDTFLYNPGMKVDIAAFYTFSPTVLMGLGTGIIAFSQNERFIPIYTTFIGFTKPNSSGTFFTSKLGYSIGWDLDYTALSDYEFSGGVLINAGLGHRFMLKNSSLLFSLSYGHQFAGAEYYTPDGEEFEEQLNFDWLSIDLTFLF